MKLGERVLLKQYKNGNKLWGTVTHCAKCGGFGKLDWTSRDDSICYDCNGKGWYYAEEREYTPANLAKLEAKREKARAEWEAQEAEREAARLARESEEARREAERLAEIERNRGQFIGNVGDKVQLTVTLAKKFDYETRFGSVSGYVFKTDDGNTVVYKTTGNPIGYEYEVPADSRSCFYTDEDGRKWDWMPMQEGERVTIKGTIKEHQEYNNVNQTILMRVKWVRK